MDRLLRAVRGKHRRLHRPGRRRGPEAADVASRQRRRPGVHARREVRRLHLAASRVHEPVHAALFGADRGRARATALDPQREPRGLLGRRAPHRLQPGLAAVPAVEALPRRRGLAGVALRRRQPRNREGPPARVARERRRADVDRRHRLFPLRPRGRVQPLFVGREVQDRPAAHEPRRLPGRERLGGRRQDRLRAGGLSPPFRSRDRRIEEADGRRRRRPAGDPPAVREGDEDASLHPGLFAVPERGPCGRRLPRRDRDGPGGKGGRAQPDQHDGGARALTRLVSRRPLHRVLLGRVRRLPALHREPGRQGRAPEVQALRRRLLRVARLVPGQQEDRVRRQCTRALLDRRRDGRFEENRRRLLLRSQQDAPPGLVARLEVDRLRRQQPRPDPDRVCPLRRSGPFLCGDGRPLRREPAGLRPQRQVPLLLRVDKRGTGQQLVHA